MDPLKHIDPEEFLNAGTDKANVPTALRWNDKMGAVELCYLDDDYEPDLVAWQKWLDDHGSQVETMDPPINAPDGTDGRPWYRITGPAARRLYDGAHKSKQALPPIEGMMFRWRNDGFEFFSKDGTELAADEVQTWNKAARKYDSTFDTRYDSEHDLTYYRVDGPFAEKLHTLAQESEPGYREQGGNTRTPDELERPEWEGTPCFRLAWQSCEWMVAHYGSQMSGASAVGHDAMSQLMDAHPIFIGIEQANVLPPLPTSEAMEYLTRANLPFNPIFFDLTDGVMGEAMATIETETGQASMGVAGGLIQRDERATIVTPFGSVVNEAIVQGQDQEEADLLRLKEGSMTLADGAGNGLPSHGPLGALVLGEAVSGRDPDRAEVLLDTNGRRMDLIEFLESDIEADDILSCFVGGNLLSDGLGVDAGVCPTIPDLASFRRKDPDAAVEHIIAWAAATMWQACKLAACLQLIESHNVVIGEAKLSRQVRRNAERKGIPITKTVYITNRRSQPKANGNGGEPTRFSHAFEVIGNTHHVTKGSHVWCKRCRGEGELIGPTLPDGTQQNEDCPDCHKTGTPGLDAAKLTVCARRDQHGNLTCPNGCRKEWVPAFVKGDGPLVMKTRKRGSDS